MARYNYTNRKRILRSEAQVDLKDTRGGVDPQIHLDLSEHGFLENAEIWFEFYTNSFLKRINYGTVKNPGIKGPRLITGGPPAGDLKVRIKVLDPDPASSKILGVMKGVKPGYKDEDGDKRNESIIDLQSASLGGEVWKLDAKQDRDDYPTLYLEEKLGDYTGVAQSASFRALVMPKVLQEILVNIIIFNEFNDSEDESIWGDWLRLAQKYSPGSSEVPFVERDKSGWGVQVQDVMTWIEDVVGSWANANEYGDQYIQFLKSDSR